MVKDKAIDRPLYNRLDPRGSHSMYLWTLKDTQGRTTTLTHHQQHHTVTYNISKHLASMLTPLVGNA